MSPTTRAAVVSVASAMLVFAVATLALLAGQENREGDENSADAQPAEWTVGFDKALAQAREADKPLLVNFTGSDWCGGCILLRREIFSQPEFKQWADEHVVLLEVDFPRGKSQPEALQEQNRAVQRHYGIKAYPTLLVLTPDGRPVDRFRGYGGDMSVEQWTEHVQPAIDEAVAQHETRQDEDAASEDEDAAGESAEADADA